MKLRILALGLLVVVQAQANGTNEDLFQAIVDGKTNQVNTYLKNDGLTEIRNQDGYTPLHWAVQKNNFDITRILLSKGARINAQCTKTKDTALHIAAKGLYYQEMIPLLLKHNARLLLRNKEKRTALEAGLEKHKYKDDQCHLKKLLCF